MNYKLIAIDLDDTLLDDHLMISKENRDALIYAHQKGIKVVLCTGRAINSVKSFVNQLEMDWKDDYFIAFNGAVVSTVHGQILFRKAVTHPHIDHLVDIGRQEGVDTQFYSDTQLYVDHYTERIMAYEGLTGTKAEVIKDLKNLEVTLKVLYNSLNPEKLDRIKTHISEVCKEELNVFYSKKEYLEVLMKEGNKGLALKYLAEYLGISKEEVIAIGDSENDSFMIDYAGLGVCMKNGRDSVKQISQYITRNTNNESGVAEVIYKFIK